MCISQLVWLLNIVNTWKQNMENNGFAIGILYTCKLLRLLLATKSNKYGNIKLKN